MLRALVIVTSLLPVAAAGQSFSCSYGRPACLDYGDKVCSSSGQCVDASAVCFDVYQCNFEGFACKSDVTACVEQYEDLQREYNDLVERHRALASRLDNLSDCVLNASTYEEARRCVP
ncbi:hypothetical protein JMM59_06560 [Rhodovulum sulfidophilum]|nr:hypothetical protein [Rhodovulum sulfidophilum]